MVRFHEEHRRHLTKSKFQKKLCDVSEYRCQSATYPHSSCGHEAINHVYDHCLCVCM